MFEPRIRCDGGFAAVAVVIEQLLALVDVSGSDEDEVRDAVDVVKFRLAVAVFTVIDQTTHSVGLFRGVHAVQTEASVSGHISSQAASLPSSPTFPQHTAPCWQECLSSGNSLCLVYRVTSVTGTYQ